MKLPVFVLAILALAACSGGDRSGQQTTLGLSCVGTGMTPAACLCLDQTAEATLDDRLYAALTKASADAEAARKTEGSEDGMMDRLPDNMDAADESQIMTFVRKLRTDCRGATTG